MTHPIPTTGLKLHGEIISWDIPIGTKIPYGTILSALDAAGLSRKAAKEIAPRSAFARACAVLSEHRIIRKVDETAASIRFQFTAEVKDAAAGVLNYNREAVVKLDKLSGQVTCDGSADLAAAAQKAVNDATEVRDTKDVSRMIQNLFGTQADLFPVRAAGGCYFVPVCFYDFLAQVEAFLSGIGGSLRRFPVPAGYAHGDRSVSEAVEDGIEAAIHDHLTAIDAFDDSTRDTTIEKMAEKINTTRFKVEAYADFLGEKKAEAEAALAEARAVLRKKIAELGKGVKVAEPAAVPAA